MENSTVWSERAENVVTSIMAKLSPVERNPKRNDSVRLQALHIGSSLWADYYLRPSGDVVIVGQHWDHPDEVTVYRDRNTVLRVLVSGSKRYPELKELLPVRPPQAIDCQCQAIPLFAEGKVLCDVCCGLGWLPPND